jgi:hypothetical protein
VFRRWGRTPDVILVDGRFRVACVLESLLNLGDQDACTILLDDYVGRAHYRAVEAFVTVVELKGRMAVLRKRPRMDAERCRDVLQGFYADYR